MRRSFNEGGNSIEDGPARHGFNDRGSFSGLPAQLNAALQFRLRWNSTRGAGRDSFVQMSIFHQRSQIFLFFCIGYDT